MIQIVAILFTDIVIIDEKILIILVLLFSLLVYTLAPVETKNKRLDEVEKKVYKKTTKIVLIGIGTLNWNNFKILKLTLVMLTIVLIFQLLGIASICNIKE